MGTCAPCGECDGVDFPYVLLCRAESSEIIILFYIRKRGDGGRNMSVRL